jgi:hypothetical protein
MRVDSSVNFNQYQGVAPVQNAANQKDSVKELGDLLQAASYQQNNMAMKMARIASQQMSKLTGLGQNFDQYA